ncbi:hypothetical protein SGRA_2991 [Saprospira grandis str. Lewin]|uniref:Uncharacterized protein n=1 Tax=Saprospira grandis (strain Lewin) TaxID=984262 RepID=H6LAX6_SAPGL|nr:hypothetical protein SGRA_2991 [Saprospira grandis str. Lewin]
MPIYKLLLLLFYFLSDEVLGLPRPLAGSGCAAARRSARPCAACGGWVWPSATAIHPSASGFAASRCKMDQRKKPLASNCQGLQAKK